MYVLMVKMNRFGDNEHETFATSDSLEEMSKRIQDCLVAGYPLNRMRVFKEIPFTTQFDISYDGE